MKNLKSLLLFCLLFSVSTVSNAQSLKSFYDSCSIDSLNGEKVYENVDERAEYPGGMGTFYKTFGQNVKFKKSNTALGCTKVIIVLIISPKGSMSVLCSSSDIDILIDKFKQWKPGIQRGKKVYTQIRLVSYIKFG
ncbi:hypothetical protein EI427_13090 [Flammeovirga pectinis]|uniref:TonB C-terminal domain-containing protein n=1 Tax=Flammeovirga pectinis TaxID=2494373 RepID=A0A3Q9FMG5_9BACT|nr:hypothetical protein [Flammeovirga pectinis]AZQ63140.1 hypothetical protein EI427_13090 [Flammeovirga pectinis]